MKEEVDKVLQETSKIAEQETAHIINRPREAAVHGRATRHLSNAEKDAAENYYKKVGHHFDSDEDTEAYVRITAMLFVYAIITGLINLVLYLPVNYLARSWGGVNNHDAVYVSIIINTVISALLVGIFSEFTTKRKAFIAGMRAEADSQVIGKYHLAKEQIDDQYASTGQIPDYDFKWKD